MRNSSQAMALDLLDRRIRRLISKLEKVCYFLSTFKEFEFVAVLSKSCLITLHVADRI